jgi:hypothetical protein
LSGARNIADTKASSPSTNRNNALHGAAHANESGSVSSRRRKSPASPVGIKANRNENTVIATPATGTQPSSMRRRSRKDAKPKPAAIPSEAAAMNIDESVPKPSPPPVRTLASFTDHRLRKLAKPQKNATPNEARRSGASRHNSARWVK